MKLPVMPNTSSLCDQCVALCCRYFAFEISKPKTRRDYEDMRWYLLHEDCIIFVEEGDWFIQINRKCRELRPDNRCGIYETRPTICREYTTDGCDYHGEEYDYEHLFTEPDQIMEHYKEQQARKRKRKTAARKKAASSQAATPARRKKAKRAAKPINLKKTA